MSQNSIIYVDEDFCLNIAKKINDEIFPKGMESLLALKEVPEEEPFALFVLNCPTRFFEKYYNKVQPKLKIREAEKAIKSAPIDTDLINMINQDDLQRPKKSDNPNNITVGAYSKFVNTNTKFYENMVKKTFENLVINLI